MDPFALPSNTEFAYAHKFDRHPYLFTQSATMNAPMNPQVPMNTLFTLAELEKRNEKMPSPQAATVPPGRRRGRR